MEERGRKSDSLLILKLYGHVKNTGGIVNFQNSLESHRISSKNQYRHFRTGRVQSSRLLSTGLGRVLDQLLSYLWFPIYLCILRPDVIEINSSLVPDAFRRDFFYAKIVRVLFPSTRLVLFNHGWDEQFFFSLIKTDKSHKLFSFFSFFDDIVVLAGEVASGVRSLEYSGRVHVITTGVDLNKFSGFAASQSNEEELQILFLSRVEKEKGIEEFLDAVPGILKEYPNTKFVVAGDGSWFSRAQEKVNDLGVQKQVHYAGYIRGEDKLKLMAQSNLFVFPSYREGCPISVLEALAIGLPIIYTQVGALPDILVNMINGLLIPKFSSKSIVDAVRVLAHDNELRNKMRDNNLMLANQFDLPIIHQKLESIYTAHV